MKTCRKFRPMLSYLSCLCLLLCVQVLSSPPAEAAASQKCLRLRAAVQDTRVMVPVAMTSYAAIDKSKDKMDAIEAKVRTLLASAEFSDLYCRKLGRYMTDDEMGKVADFFSTPAGTKWRDSIGAVQQSALISMGVFLQSKSAEFTKQGLPAFPD